MEHDVVIAQKDSSKFTASLIEQQLKSKQAYDGDEFTLSSDSIGPWLILY